MDLAAIWHCRFSAHGREYKYYIVQHGELDIAAMQQAAAHFVGTHDFRSFCKVDAQHVSTFCRTILDFRQGLFSCLPLSACSQTKRLFLSCAGIIHLQGRKGG